MSTRFSATVGLVCLTSAALLAQGPPPGPDMTIDAAARTTVLDGVTKELRDFYVFPEMAARMADAIDRRRARGEYDAIMSARSFAEALTTHLRGVSRDKHLTVNYSNKPLPSFPYPPPPPPAEEIQRMTVALSQRNFGFERVERLAGNIGYFARAIEDAKKALDTGVGR